MYRYDEFDAQFVRGRVSQFRDQVTRRLAGELTEDQFKPLRLMNGLYLQLHAYMLRVAIPYGTLNGKQMRQLAVIAREYDRGYGHFTTRQNIQFNWPALVDTPEILEKLADVEMHAIQTSGNCIRNVTTDQFAGAALDELEDPRPYAEILRQWSSLHPEFTYLPRKFKIAITGAKEDRAAIRVHDIGLQLVKNAAGEVGFEVYVGGGQGRTPMIARLVNAFVPKHDLIAYTEAILRVYNMFGRRDNKYKARIKILVHETGLDELKSLIDAEFAETRNSELTLPEADIAAIQRYFASPNFNLAEEDAEFRRRIEQDRSFANWFQQNTHPHKTAGHVSLTISLKPIGGIPGDASADQMDVVAHLAETYGYDEIRVSHEQNLVLPHVKTADLPRIYDALVDALLATDNVGLISDIIACPGLDYCALANARSIPIAQQITERFADGERAREIGKVGLKISGCINACGHHHVGGIGILGVDKKGDEMYQITLGGAPGNDASIGEVVGRGFSESGVVDAIETIVDTYLAHRDDPEEDFVTAYRRLGSEPFKTALYGPK